MLEWALRRCCAPAVFVLSLITSGGSAWAQAAPTTIVFPWDWHIEIVPVGSTVPIPIGLWGEATIAFGQPSDGMGGTYPLGPGGGPGAPALQPPPPGNWTIPIEIVSMQLTSMGPIVFPQGPTEVIVRQNPRLPSLGRIDNLQNNGDGTIRLDSFFDVFVEIELPDLGGMRLENVQPATAGMSFGTSAGGPFPLAGPLPELDVLWAPTWLWAEGFGRDLLDINPPHALWDVWISIHAHVTPEPSSLALVSLAGILLAAPARRIRRRCAA
jgi:hypothetical protein